MNSESPSPELLAGRRALDGMPDVQLLSDWEWNPPVRSWVIHVRLTPSVDQQGMIPASTEWYVLVHPDYPQGPIKFFPSKSHGIVVTFPHQRYNGESRPDLPWRLGDLCLDTNLKILGRFDIEPFDIHHRLEWHFHRALGWLTDASKGHLIANEDPFELPQFPSDGSIRTVAFSESPETYAIWQASKNTCGRVEFQSTKSKPQLFLVKKFLSLGGMELVSTNWGTKIEQSSDISQPIEGFWLRLPCVPVLKPWQAPYTWRDLRFATNAHGVEIDSLLRKCAPAFRDDKPHLVLLGFPIPENIGGPLGLMHWLAVWTPPLSIGKVRGFRNSEVGRWNWDRGQIFGESKRIDWQGSENWHHDQISTRGRLQEHLRRQRVLVIGAGAVGAVVSELLARGGVQELTIIDGDALKVGNLTRHTLSIDNIGDIKSIALADKLNKALPHVTARGINQHFPPATESDTAWLQDQDVIVDCTGNDHVLYQIETFPWRCAKAFFSISLGFQARRLFFYAQTRNLTFGVFQREMQPWLMKELDEIEKKGLPREAVGCWHPVFPARADEVWFMSSAAIPMIESYISQNQSKPTLTVFEKVYKDGHFMGLRQATEVRDDT